MSQNSKVNLAVRNAILNFLSPGTKSTNAGLRHFALPTISSRTVQEATQKLAAEGVLVSVRESGRTWYHLPVTATTSVDVNVGEGTTSIETVGDPRPASQFTPVA